jgi:hypothetical protein
LVQTDPCDEDHGPGDLVRETVYDSRPAVGLRPEEEEEPGEDTFGGRDSPGSALSLSQKGELATQTDAVAGLPELKELQVGQETLLKDSTTG